MHSLAVARRRPLQLIDRALDPVPDGPPLHVTSCQQLVRALVELIYARASGVPPLGDIGGWNVTRLLDVIGPFTGVRMTP